MVGLYDGPRKHLIYFMSLDFSSSGGDLAGTSFMHVSPTTRRMQFFPILKTGTGLFYAMCGTGIEEIPEPVQ